MKTVEVLAISMLLLGNTVYGDCLLSRDEQASAEINISKQTGYYNCASLLVGQRGSGEFEKKFVEI